MYNNHRIFGGLAKREEYWGFYLFHIFFILLFLLINNSFVNIFKTYDDTPYGLIVYAILTLIPSLSIFIRRLRDAEVNILLFIVLSIISGILIPIGNPITIIIGVILVLLLLFVLFFKKGNMSAECVVSVSTNEKDEGSDL
jgi:uncharacterized membrane protein YhaH (DUF805 family)